VGKSSKLQSYYLLDSILVVGSSFIGIASWRLKVAFTGPGPSDCTGVLNALINNPGEGFYFGDIYFFKFCVVGVSPNIRQWGGGCNV